ncbi:MEKHLA domain-containing protein [Croceicoccus estronivorus]|nr:MEKHLA domain-containing protein [Croceicoccus estronivorus]
MVETHAGSERIALIADSFRRVTGNTLLPPDGNLDPASAIWRAPMVVLAHGTEADPVFFYGNRLALDLFEASADAFINLPSRFSAEPMERQERARFLAQVADHNCITDYSGIRISQTGQRFRIERATVWNLLDADGAIHGQAACFDRWAPVT